MPTGTRDDHAAREAYRDSLAHMVRVRKLIVRLEGRRARRSAVGRGSATPDGTAYTPRTGRLAPFRGGRVLDGS